MRNKYVAKLWNSLNFIAFWKQNYLLLKEVKYFMGSVALAVSFTLLGAVFEGFGIGFILSFLQSLTSPDSPPIQTGLEWFDIQILGVNLSATARLYRICFLILLTTFFRLSFVYLG
ncbi:MAG: ABC transporter ATP-binding protein, partial [Cyanobacteria bacterium P01_A01_bin.17]